MDVVVFVPAAPGQSRRILSLGEVKWGQHCGHAGILREQLTSE
jgi:hypothetical protein